MKDFIIYNQEVAAKLMLLKNKLLQIKENQNNSDFNIFLFKDTEKLKKDLDFILNQK